MREILFRGKRLDNGEWVEGDLRHGKYYGGDNTVYIMYENYALHNCPVDPETVGQYTGLKDRNGKRIFEGDILRFGLFYDYMCYLESLEHPEHYDNNVCDTDIDVDVVVWGCDWDYPAFDLKNHQFDCNGLAQLLCGGYEYEVIGNIHDNPELLKEDK